MQGFTGCRDKMSFTPFGFDDNGLPTERLVEKEEGIIAQDMPRSEFIKKCINTTQKYEAEFKKLWQSLGFSIDWSLQYETISPLARRISQKSFLDLAGKGKAYLKETPVLWCTNCRTSIAQAELDSLEKETAFNWIPFQVEAEELIAATTRPELLCGCVALFIHPEDERYAKYIGKKAIVPLYDFPIPILGDKRVSKEKGTGIVMCATFGDTTDLEWYNDYRLPYKKIINPDGTVNDDVPFIHGLSVGEAKEKIISKLRGKGLLRKSEKILHTVAVHERCGKDTEIITSRQWFIDILNDKDKFLDAADKINWYPSSMKTRYEIWVRNLKWDWCISRQRYFGVPFPLWYCRDCGSIVFAREEDLPVNPLESSPKEPCSCGSNSFIPEDAVLDTWATSSLTPLINSKWGEKGDTSGKLLPMSMRTQAHEIIRTWAFYSIVKSIYHTGQIPWKDYCDNYLEIAKERLYQPEIHGHENRLSAQFALYNSFLGILKMYAIYVPHMVEEIYQAYFREYEKTASIHKTIWSRTGEADENILRFGETVKQILSEIRKYKSERKLSLKTELDTIRIFSPQSFIPLLEETRKDLHACTGAKTIEFREGEGLVVVIGTGGFSCINGEFQL